MKPFLSVDLTENKKNEEFNGQEFIIQRPSEAAINAFERSQAEAEETITESKLPLPMRVIQWICGALGVMLTAGILKAFGGEDGVSLTEAYANADWLFWLAGGCLLVWAVLMVMGRKKQKDVLESDESAQTFSHVDTTADNIFAELSVPETAKEADILSFFYIVKDENIKVREKGLQAVPYINLPFRVYTDSENLYLVNFDGKFAFPLSSLQCIRTVKKTIGAASWHKDELPDKGVYKQYKITVDDYGCIHFKTYHILELEHNSERWGIYFPSYELPIFESLTGLKAE